MIYKHSKQRQAVLDAVLLAGHHVSADEVFAILKSQNSGIGIATIYRNLNLLAEWGMISRLQDPEKGNVYESAEHRHYHLHCTKCNRIYDVPIDYAEELDMMIAEKMGAIVSGHSMVFEGICQECREKKEAE